MNLENDRPKVLSKVTVSAICILQTLFKLAVKSHSHPQEHLEVHCPMYFRQATYRYAQTRVDKEPHDNQTSTECPICIIYRWFFDFFNLLELRDSSHYSYKQINIVSLEELKSTYAGHPLCLKRSSIDACVCSSTSTMVSSESFTFFVCTDASVSALSLPFVPHETSCRSIRTRFVPGQRP